MFVGMFFELEGVGYYYLSLGFEFFCFLWLKFYYLDYWSYNCSDFSWGRNLLSYFVFYEILFSIKGCFLIIYVEYFKYW